MKNPWELRPLMICATPIVAGLLQIVVLGFSTAGADTVPGSTIHNAFTFLILLFPLVSLPALFAAVGGMKAGAPRGWYAAGAVLNAAYCLLLAAPIQTIASVLASGAGS